ncbi:MAG: iron export ABC transporter permease subunit FetB [Thermoplasmatota archaeon]
MSGIPYTWDQGLVILAMVMVLFFIVIAISIWKKVGIAKEYTYALARGAVQLFLTAAVLYFIFEFEFWYYPIWLILAAMAAMGGYTSARRAGKMPHAYRITTPSILFGATIVLIVLAVTGAMPMEPQFVIPLSGMVFGNSMTICSLALNRLLREFESNKPALETMLSLGATPKEATKEYSRMSIKAALIPNIDSLKTLGIIFIPGAMAGLLIAGTNPILAAEYQIIVYLMIIGGGIITSLMVVTLSRRTMFTGAHQLAEWL